MEEKKHDDEIDDFLDQYGDLEVSRELVEFKYSHAFSLQLSYKLFSNSIYGLYGDRTNSFYNVTIAGAVTTLGKENILRLNAFLEDKNCKIIYNDTDSAYFSAPSSLFHDIDIKYYSNQMDKLEYCTEIVKMTQKYVSQLQPKVNQYLRETSNAPFLKVAYEEVLFPVLWTAKKKYIGHPHIDSVNFDGELFIRGLNLVRRDSSVFLNIVSEEILRQAVDINNTYELIHLCKKKLFEVYQRSFDKKDFAKSENYKPNKQNIKIHTFNKRMKERSTELNRNMCPTPGERFDCVIVKKYPWIYDSRGRRTALQVGDKLEYLWYAEENNLEIDMDHYIQHELAGAIARIVTYHMDFHVDPIDESDEAHKKSEEEIFKKAKKYIETLVKSPVEKNLFRGDCISKSFKFIESNLKNELSKVGTSSSCLELLTANHRHDQMLKKYGVQNSSNENNKKRVILNETIEKVKIQIVKHSIKNATIWTKEYIKSLRDDTINRRFAEPGIKSKKQNDKKRYNQILNNLKTRYHKIREERRILWRKKKNYILSQLVEIASHIVEFHQKLEEFYDHEVSMVCDEIDIDELDVDKDKIDWNEILSGLNHHISFDTLLESNDQIISESVRLDTELISIFEKIIIPDKIIDDIMFTIKANNNIIDKPRYTSSTTLSKYLSIFNE